MAIFIHRSSGPRYVLEICRYDRARYVAGFPKCPVEHTSIAPFWINPSISSFNLDLSVAMLVSLQP